MSLTNLSNLIRRADTDEDLRKKVIDAVGDDGNAAAMAEVGAKHGFDFTAEEAHDALAAYAFAAEQESSRELSKEEMKGVSGGVFPRYSTSIVDSFQANKRTISFNKSSFSNFGVPSLTVKIDELMTKPPWA